MGFSTVKALADADAAGRTFTSHFRKNFTSATISGWLDLSMFGGGPPPNYYASNPLESATLDGNRGFYVGDNKSPAARYLTHWGIVANNTNLRGQYMLLDYLMYYPFVDCDDLALQEMTNTVTLPRYTDGEGVMVMPVCVAAGAGSGVFTFEYVNQDGDTKTSPTQTLGTTAPGLANLLGGLGAPSFNQFCLLAHGDRGVRSITSVTFTVPNGGLMALVLVKVLADNAVREASTMSEKEFVSRAPGSPRVYDGSYLNILLYSTISITSTALTGYLKFAWDEG